MKKVFLFAIATVAISLASCANKGNADNASANDSIPTSVEVVEKQTVVTDSASNDTVIMDEVAVSQEAPAKK